MRKEQEGIVINLNNCTAKVKVSRHGDCENCGSCPGSNAMVLEVNNAAGAKKGDHVVFELKENNMLKAAFIVYIFPLVSIFIGAMAGLFLSNLLNINASTFEITCGITAFIISIGLIVYYERSSRSNINRLPKIVRVN